jgi:glycosyltransferase involved in cell wall biosynthesis
MLLKTGVAKMQNGSEKLDAECVPADYSAVVLVSNGFQSDYEAGFANGLAANGVRPVLIASDRTLLDRLLPSVEVLNLRGSQEERRPGWQKALQLLLYTLRLSLLLARRRPVTHLTGLFILSRFHGDLAEVMWGLECRLWKLLSRRLLLTVHNVLPHGRDTPGLRRRMTNIYTIPDRLVVHTSRMRDRLVGEFNVDPARITIMEHGIDRLASVSPDRVAATRSGLGALPGQKLVLNFGIVQRYKGVDLLIKAVRFLDEDTRIHIAGRCNDSNYKAELDDLLTAQTDGTQITWENDWLSEDRVDDLLASADLLALPYRHIDQSGVLFAALRHGLPIVAFDVGSFREYLIDGIGTVVEPENIKAFAAAIRDTDCGAGERAAIRAHAKRFLWSATVRSVLNEYKRVK